MTNNSVTNEKIVRLQAGAQGFRSAFYIIYNSMLSKEGCESWAQEGDVMSVLGTNGCFALELYLKFMMVIDSFNVNTLSGNHIKGHKLDELYNALDNQNHSYIQELEKEYSNSKYTCFFKTLKDFLTSIIDYFIDWRYSYDSGSLNINLNLLSDVLNIFEKFTNDKYLSVSEILAQNGISFNDDQTMSIYDFDDIKKHI